MSDQQWVVRADAAPRDGFDLVIDDRTEGWQHTGLRIATLDAGEQLEVPAGAWEYVVVPLAGPVDVAAAGPSGTEAGASLAGRASVFAGPTDVAFVPAGWSLRLTGAGEGSRVALCAAAVPGGAASYPFRHVRVDEVPVELRGAGIASREVRNFGVPDVLGADRIIACEVVTPAGNWSSYPPHKHDEERDGEETELEEIYYFEVQRERSEPAGPGEGQPGEAGQSRPVGYQRVYGTDERPIDVLAEVRTGDVVLVPHGWHGPAMAPPGYDLYYLNVMAGPGPVRAWLICDDPAHAWVRDTWGDQQVDPRLPMGGET
ncbi:5-deoxy-glucuronate isomerase [Nocardioides rotundus]|uniref:5-deoxy-glucuronate isomerase n=1 Tax=Nocardioides rotundus TaxID=1774216 RepID=UPI001CBF4086|nr:5-deoxy-glucuronate isomerase [Nocardioides rotundus]UAL28990.1 5-deoxy-glucuronate isomerase [Nocardioides rotundus]